MFILKSDFGKGKVAPVHAMGICGMGEWRYSSTHS